MKTLKEFKNDFNNIDCMKLFEIQVINNNTNEVDYINFEIEIQGRSFIAIHESLTIKEQKSKKIAFVKLKIDLDFNIDSHLLELYERCENKILDSDFFNLPL